MTDYLLKDIILRYMKGKSVVETRDMTRDLNIDIEQCALLLKRMNADGNIAALNLHGDSIHYATKLSTAGVLFLEDGGYTSQHNANRKEKINKTASQIATWVIAVMTLALTAWQIYLTDKTNGLEKKNEALQKQVDSLIRK
jgi:hypothetical protein